MDRLVAMTGRKRTYFYKRFKMLTGLTSNQFVHRLRMQAAVYLLLNSDLSITDIAYDCGYSTVEFFDNRFRQSQGMSPRALRKSIRLI
ncbi:helix-turn-helix domain-containing protein [Paenibacillus piri]|uniref:AraC family transcriptional regulator n=1 Tax=Paenibacillus piri TaxID=2547395 RepID=A0A4R5KBG6_9BACL|nr:AraC family transcriptional regulator [Paenibacillus piri]TDF91875.1 AraC family transcriptional regulator [Paenibacillus piri]